MALITIPNVSEGRDEGAIEALRHTLSTSGCRILDVHADGVHNRSVLTATGPTGALVDGLSALGIQAVRSIDLRRQTGVHPRVGVLDVCPVVPHEEPMENAIAAARAIGSALAQRSELPVYLYDLASDPPRPLPDLRRGGLSKLIERCRAGLLPDFGPPEIDPARGVVCVGARDVLIAFNVWVRASEAVAQSIAATARELEGVRALGLQMPGGEAQVSMNLTRPDVTGIDDAFELIAHEARGRGVEIVKTEIVGLVPERFLPSPDAEAARHLVAPGRSLESVLTA